jgi:hypothetical protein
MPKDGTVHECKTSEDVTITRISVSTGSIT